MFESALVTYVLVLVVYYESIKRDIQIRCIYEFRCNERLQTKTKEFTCLVYTGLVVELEHLKIETRLIDEKFPNTMGEYVCLLDLEVILVVHVVVYNKSKARAKESM